MKEFLLGIILSLPGLFLAISIHEFAHGWAAYKLGDNTAKYSGRLSLNPLAHFDLVGTISLLIFRFGWAKPVPINPNNFKNRRKGIIIVSLAGPFANLISAVVFAFILAIAGKLMGFPSFNSIFGVSGYLFSGGITSVRGIAVMLPILYYCVILNIGLMAFNLIPIPPLDGSKVLLELLPYRAREVFYNFERYSFLILMILLVTDTLNPILSFVTSGIYGFIEMITRPIF